MNAVGELLQEATRSGIRLKRDGEYILAEGPMTGAFLAQLRRHKPELLRALGDTEAEDLREAFEERAGILEHDGGLSRDRAETEAARMVATLARNRGYSWAALREALQDQPELLARIPDRPGRVDSLPLGVAKLAVLPRGQVVRQGTAHEAAGAPISTDPAIRSESGRGGIKQGQTESNDALGELSR